MSEPAVVSTRRVSDRRREVEDRLRGLVSGPRPVPPDGRRGPDEQDAELLRTALGALGPIFGSFGRYLSTRLDLLPRRDCLELARIEDRRPPSPLPAIDAELRREFGGRGTERFHTFTPAPFESG